MIPMWPLRPRMIGSAALPTSGVIGDARALDVERAADHRRQDGEGDEVEHDRGHDFVGARDRLEEARDEAPDRAEQPSRPPATAGWRRAAGLSRSCDADDDRAEGAHQELALGADVEQPGLEAEPDRQAAEEQRRRVARAC